ncbi:hypothetical protein [Mucilaginibacter sp.]|uniref:hypothetical protein n=1 Tax=Mucilaginibacter sp. TaxID=1882438 RepID=UPI003D0A4596
MLTLYEFNAMDDNGQAEAVFKEGIYVDDREDSGLKIQLYRLNSFYVEVFYDAIANRITRYRSFSALAQLAPYVKLT